MQSIWSGSLSFGLVNIPVKLYTATQSHSLNFDMLRKNDFCKVRYMRICEHDGQEISYENIVKGYEYDKGEYVILSDKDFENANVEQTHTIAISDFVNENEVDSLFFEKPYYLEPDRGGDRSYALLREALKKSHKVGVATFVIRHRGHLGIIKAEGNIIILNQIRYIDEIKNSNELHLPIVKNIKPKELELALTLINKLSGKFKPSKYHDSYIEDLKKTIDAKATGKKIQPKGKAPKPTKIIDIMTVLKKSLKEHEKVKYKTKLKKIA